MQNHDALASLGYLALGSRLKRLGEQLQAGVAEIMTESGEPVPPGQLPLLVAIDEGGAPTVAQLVEAMGMSQPGVSRMLGALQRSALVTLKSDARDARVRRAELSASGKLLLERLRGRMFPQIAAAARNLCEGVDLLDALAIVERRNRDIPFSLRVRDAQS